MSPGKVVLQKSQRQLQWLAVAVVLSLALVGGSYYLRDSLATRVAENQANLTAQQQLLTQRQLDLENIHEHADKFRALRAKGLVGNGDREGWVEQLGQSRAALRLPDTLTYHLGRPRSIEDADVGSGAGFDAAPDIAEATEGAPADGQAPQVNDLDFELTEVHEGEVLALIDHYRRAVHGQFRIQSCRLGGAAPNGLSAKCSLRFFNLPEKAEES